jgi:hypothetical protein
MSTQVNVVGNVATFTVQVDVTALNAQRDTRLQVHPAQSDAIYKNWRILVNAAAEREIANARMALMRGVPSAAEVKATQDALASSLADRQAAVADQAAQIAAAVTVETLDETPAQAVQRVQRAPLPSPAQRV